jgi:CheY-like chemotaxis protein
MEAVGRLAGGIAHDFNNLLTVINGYSDVAAGMLRPGDPLREMNDQIRKAGDRAATLTRQLLAFSRKQVLVPSVIDLNVLLKEMERMLGRLIGEDIDLKFLAEPDLWKIKVDPGQMEQVVMNLVVNSRDAMPDGGTLIVETKNVKLDTLYSSSHPDLPTGEYVMLAVSDSGCGMDEGTKARIFEPFFTTKGERGTGLGLATVFGIVKRSGGGVNVYSEVRIGTTFKIYIPREKEPGRASSKVFGKPRHGTETILLVEDEDGVRTLARLVLQRFGYTVLDARNGGEALLLCGQQQGDIHLMITDVVMPKMSGRELVERFHAARPGTKVLYTSGYTAGAIEEKGVLEPGTEFLQKPFSFADLTQKVRSVLDS